MPPRVKIGAVLSWIATVILIVALFVPGYQLRYQMKTEKGTFKDIPATMTSELKQMKEAAKLNFQFGAGTTSDKIDEFVEKGSTSVFSYLVSPDLQKARLVNLETMVMPRMISLKFAWHCWYCSSCWSSQRLLLVCSR